MKDRQPSTPTPPAPGATTPPRGPAAGEAPPGGAATPAAGSAVVGSSAEGMWLLHPDAILSPLFAAAETNQVYREIFDVLSRLRTPADATKADMTTAAAAFLKVNSKCFDATEQATATYADLLPRTIKRMSPDEFKVRRAICLGLFLVTDGLVEVLGKTRSNAILRTDELADQARFALEEAREAATGPEGQMNPQAQALYNILNTAFQDLTGKQQQGRHDNLKVEGLIQAASGDKDAQLAAAMALIAQMKSTIEELQREKLLSPPPAAPTPPAPKHHGKTTPQPPAPATPGTTPTPNSRTLPRK